VCLYSEHIIWPVECAASARKIAEWRVFPHFSISASAFRYAKCETLTERSLGQDSINFSRLNCSLSRVLLYMCVCVFCQRAHFSRKPTSLSSLGAELYILYITFTPLAKRPTHLFLLQRACNDTHRQILHTPRELNYFILRDEWQARIARILPLTPGIPLNLLTEKMRRIVIK